MSISRTVTGARYGDPAAGRRSKADQLRVIAASQASTEPGSMVTARMAGSMDSMRHPWA